MKRRTGIEAIDSVATYLIIVTQIISQAIREDLVLGHIVCFNIDVTLQGNREETPADVEKARQEAQELHDAGAKQWGADESKFNQVIALRSFPQLRATFDEYAKVSP